MRWSAAGLAAAAALGCGGPSAGDPDDTPLPLATAECVEGAWVREASCFCERRAEAWRTPECEASDCIFSQVIVMRADGSAFQFEAQRSDERATVSTVLSCVSVARMRWSVPEPGQLVWTEHDDDADEYRMSAGCSAERLMRDEPTPYHRAPPGLGVTLIELPTTDDCTEVPYVPGG